MELWLNKNHGLVPKEDWEQQIDELRLQTGSLQTKRDVCSTKIKAAITNAIAQRIPQHKYGVFLSGGVDSSLLAVLAHRQNTNTTNMICYTIGYKGTTEARDVTSSRMLAKTFNLQWNLKILTLDEIEEYIIRAVKILSPVNLIDSVSIGIAVVIIAAVEEAKKDKIKTFIGGLGAEEIFAGYKRHLDVSDVNEECWRGLRAMWTRDLVRDAALATGFSIEVRTPFLDKEVINAAMRCPGNWKIADGQRKIILREIAESLGVPKDIAWRNKQAAQYGSGVDKAIEKLAKKRGYRDKGEYLKNKC